MPYNFDDDLLDQYEYATDIMLQEKLHDIDRINLGSMRSYASGINSFGMQMTASQNRVAK